MRKLLLAGAIAAVLYSGSADAQSTPGTITYRKDTLSKVASGAKLGANFASMDGKESFKEGFNVGFTAGGFIRVERKKLGVQVEGLVNYVRFQGQDTFLSGGTFSALYIDIPILFEYNVVKPIWLQIGPQFSTLLSVSHDPALSIAPKDLFQSFNFSGVVGLEARLPMNLAIGARYAMGLININDHGNSVTNEDWKLNTIQGYLSLKLN